MMTAQNIARQLAQQAENIARYLLPNGKKIGHEWRVGSTAGESGQSLGVHLAGEKIGVWCDFATGESGDLLDLWAATRKIPLSAAIQEARRHLGYSQPHFEAHKPSNFVKPAITIHEAGLGSAVMNYLVYERKLLPETIRLFRVGESKRDIVFYYLRDSKLIAVKYLGLDRKDGKKQIRVEKNCEPCLYGWQAVPASARKIALTEGEIDAITLHQYGFPSLSLPFGGGTGQKHRWIEFEFDRLSVFDEIYLCLDQDAEGLAATMELVERLGRHRCYVVKLPYKDANACLQAGITQKEIERCFISARTIGPAGAKARQPFCRSGNQRILSSTRDSTWHLAAVGES